MKRGGLFGAWGGREELFGVGGEEVASVGRVEALGEDDDFGIVRGLGGFADFGGGVGEVGGFVGAGGQLDAGYLYRGAEEACAWGGGGDAAG